MVFTESNRRQVYRALQLQAEFHVFGSGNSSRKPNSTAQDPTSLTAALVLPNLESSSHLAARSRFQTLKARVEAKCLELGGTKPIHRILVANNGIAAVKFIRSTRSWAYSTFGDERAISLLAMATPEDMQVDAEHIRLADQFAEVQGGSNKNNFANVERLSGLLKRVLQMLFGQAGGMHQMIHSSQTPFAEAPITSRFWGHLLIPWQRSATRLEALFLPSQTAFQLFPGRAVTSE